MTTTITPLEIKAIHAYVIDTWPTQSGYGSRLKGPHHAPRARLWDCAGNSHDMAPLRDLLGTEITTVSIYRGRGYGGDVEFVPAELARLVCLIRREIAADPLAALAYIGDGLTLDDILDATDDQRDALIGHYGQRYEDDLWVRRQLEAAARRGTACPVSRAARWDQDQEHEGRHTEPCWQYRGRDLRVQAYLPYGDDRDLRRFEHEGNATLRSLIWQACGMRLAPALPAIHTDDYGTLRRMIDGSLIVQVLNSTPEPDGTYRDYFLAVPPDMRTAREAVAWTFGLTPAEYELSAQS